MFFTNTARPGTDTLRCLKVLPLNRLQKEIEKKNRKKTSKTVVARHIFCVFVVVGFFGCFLGFFFLHKSHCFYCILLCTFTFPVFAELLSDLSKCQRLRFLLAKFLFSFSSGIVFIKPTLTVHMVWFWLY